MRQHLRHCFQCVCQELLKPGDADRRSRREVRLVDSHDDDKIGGMSKHRPVLKAIEIIIFVTVTQFMDECNAVQLVQWLQRRPYMLVECCEELLDVRIV